MSFCRGTEFRKPFMRIGDSLLPHFPNVPVLLFTATAPEATQALLKNVLHMTNPVLVAENPDRHNITYVKYVRPPSQSPEAKEHLHGVITDLCTELSSQKLDFPITVVYTDTDTIGYCYWLTERIMQKEQYIGDPIPENRIFAQYHQVYSEEMKIHIINELSSGRSKVRLIFATVALGMGLDAPNIRRIIHYKPPTSLEKYFQETGRAGRDGKQARATVYFNNTDIRKNRPGIRPEIIKFCRSEKECLREMMLKYFGHNAPLDRKRDLCCSVCNTSLLN